MREEEGTGDSGQDFVGSARMLVEPIRLRVIMACKFSQDFRIECVTRLWQETSR